MKRLKAILVHGTFARDTHWDDPDAPFSTKLRELLGAEGAALDAEEFRWSGVNSHDARREAALELAEKIRAEGKGDYDDVFVIAHSHGGTVVRLALNLLEEGERPSGVFTFGSPFVRFRPRAVDWITNVVLWLFRAAAVIAVFMVASWMVTAPLLENDGLNAAAVGVFALVAFDFLVLWLPKRVGRSIRKSLTEIQSDLVRKYDPPERRPVSYICYHAVFDEAGLLLRFWSMFTWVLQTLVYTFLNGAFILLFVALIGAVWHWLALLDVLGGEWTELAFSDLIAFLRSFTGASWVREEPVPTVAGYLPLSLAIASFTIVVGLLLVSLAVAPLSVIMPWLIRTQWFAFGGERFLWNVAAEIHVDRFASSRSQVRYRFLPKAFLKGAMQHNFYYEDEKIIRDIAQTIATWRELPETVHWQVERRIADFFSFAFLAAVVLAVGPLAWVYAELGAQFFTPDAVIETLGGGESGASGAEPDGAPPPPE